MDLHRVHSMRARRGDVAERLRHSRVDVRPRRERARPRCLWHHSDDVVRFSLRYQGSSLELPATGAFIIGRGSTCDLVLDDALVSRRHASIERRIDGLYLEDLGSRNGILLNGLKVDGARRLAHRDRITVGAHDLSIEAIGETTSSRMTHSHPTLDGRKPLPTLPEPVELEEETTVVGTLLGGLALKALALGRFDEAERVVSRSLHELLARAQRGEPISPVALSEASGFAVRIAEGTRKAPWIDWLFEIHAATGVLMSRSDIEKLHEVVRRANYTNVGAVRRYLTRVSKRAEELGPAQRFQLQQLEGLLRVVSA